jgi:DNA-binding NarL/FixJ family response regulator
MHPKRRIAVMIVTDQQIMRDGLRLRIQQEADMCVVCEASDLSQTIRDLRLCRPEVVVIDLHSPQGVGQQAVRALRMISPGTPLVVLADYPGEVSIPPRVGESVTLIVPKMLANEQVIPAIRKGVSDSQGSNRAAPK